MNQESPSLLTAVRTLSIILIALCLGMASFAGVILAVMKPDLAPNNWSVLTLMGLGLTVLMLVMRLILPTLVVKGQLREAARREKDDDKDKEQLAGLYQTSGIIGAALLEGAGFLNLVAFMQEGNPASLAAAGLILLAVLTPFPTLHRAADWMDDRLAELREMRAKI